MDLVNWVIFKLVIIWWLLIKIILILWIIWELINFFEIWDLVVLIEIIVRLFVFWVVIIDETGGGLDWILFKFCIFILCFFKFVLIR